jgi:large subunit ribosomal protein L28
LRAIKDGPFAALGRFRPIQPPKHGSCQKQRDSPSKLLPASHGLWYHLGLVKVQISVWSDASMALACEICNKKPQYGNTISHAHNVTRRRWNPNLRRVRAVVKGTNVHIRVCTSCIRSGRVTKAA